MFEGVNRIPAGHRLVKGANGKYALQEVGCDVGSRETTHADVWRALITTCSQLKGERVALASGGGLDSSLLAAALREAGVDFVVGTMVTPGLPESDESDWGEYLAKHFNVPHYPFDITRHLPFEDVSVFMRHPELGPALHPGISYEGSFFRHLRDRGFETIVGGWGADEFFSLSRGKWLLSEALRGNWRVVFAEARPRELHRVLRVTASTAAHHSGMTSHDRLPPVHPGRWAHILRQRDSSIPLGTEQVASHAWDLANHQIVRLQRFAEVKLFQPFKSRNVIRVRLGMRHGNVAHQSADKIVLRTLARPRLPSPLSERLKRQTFSAVVHLGWRKFVTGRDIFEKHLLMGERGWVDERRLRLAINIASDEGRISPLLFRTMSLEWWLRALV